MTNIRHDSIFFKPGGTTRKRWTEVWYVDEKDQTIHLFNLDGVMLRNNSYAADCAKRIISQSYGAGMEKGTSEGSRLLRDELIEYLNGPGGKDG